MKANLLKQIRNRFDIKIVYKTLSTVEYLYKDKKTGKYYSDCNFTGFILQIGSALNRFWEFSGYISKRKNKRTQNELKRKFNN